MNPPNHESVLPHKEPTGHETVLLLHVLWVFTVP